MVDEAIKLAKAWEEHLYMHFQDTHPIVFRKVVREVLKYTKKKNLREGLVALANELLEMHKKNKNINSVKIALTYNKYYNNIYGSVVKLYVDGFVSYNPRSVICCRFVICGGRRCM